MQNNKTDAWLCPLLSIIYYISIHKGFFSFYQDILGNITNNWKATQNASEYGIYCKTDIKYSLAIENRISYHGGKYVKEIWGKNIYVYLKIAHNKNLEKF